VAIEHFQYSDHFSFCNLGLMNSFVIFYAELSLSLSINLFARADGQSSFFCDSLLNFSKKPHSTHVLLPFPIDIFPY